MDSLTIAGLVAAALLGGFVDTIAGGGGLIVAPALFAAGLPPKLAFGTSKLQAAVGSFSASATFIGRKEIRLIDVWPAILASFSGSVCGTLLIERLDPSFLRQLVPILLIAIALYTLASTRLTRKLQADAKPLLGPIPFSIGAGLTLGAYDGFFGPGAGSFWAIAHVVLRGYDLRRATVNTKLVNCASNIASLIVFAFAGHVIWLLGLAMAAGQFIGARAGAHMVLNKGTSLIRPLLVVMSLGITARIVWTDPDNWIRQAIEWIFL
jgi:uncharacterized membrane protein YfcA